MIPPSFVAFDTIFHHVHIRARITPNETVNDVGLLDL